MKPVLIIYASILFALTAATPASAQGGVPRKRIAVLIFDGAEVIDYAGPYEVFEDRSRFDLFTVAPTDAAVSTGDGLKVQPNYSFASAPQADVLIIPGGAVGKVSKESTVLDWIKAQSLHTEITMSVCNGAFILANTGALDGLSATTTRGNIQALRKAHPQIKVVRDRRFVDNGHYITTGGVSAGIDGALHVQSRLLGKGYAQANALYLEYQMHGERDYLPATFAVNAIPSLELSRLGSWSIISTEGDANHWTQVAEVRSDLGADELRHQLEQAYAITGKWTPAGDGYKGSNAWTFVDAEGQRWLATLLVQPVKEIPRQFRFTIKVNRMS